MRLEELRKDWDALGRIDPMWAVLTDPALRERKWDAESFFATGREEIAGVMRDLERLGRPARRGRCLDFGCGVGRLTQALAEHFERCDGVDIAPSMLEEARKLNRHGARCVFHFNDTDDLGLFPDGTFDFIYSNIVLQHVGPAAAEAYIREFPRLLAPSGVAMFQLPSERIREDAEIAAPVPASVAQGERFDDRLTLVASDRTPMMRMDAIPLNEVVTLLADAGGKVIEVREDFSCGREWRGYRYVVERAACDTEPAPILPSMSVRVPDDEWVSARIERAHHEREMALATVKRLEYRVAELEADRVVLKNRMEEAESYVAAVKTSKAWRIVQVLRSLVGRRW